MCVVCRPVKALGLHPFITAVAQLAGIYGLGILMTLSAYAGYVVLAIILEVAELYAFSSHCAVACKSGHHSLLLHKGVSCACVLKSPEGWHPGTTVLRSIDAATAQIERQLRSCRGWGSAQTCFTGRPATRRPASLRSSRPSTSACCPSWLL